MSERDPFADIPSSPRRSAAPVATAPTGGDPFADLPPKRSALEVVGGAVRGAAGYLADAAGDIAADPASAARQFGRHGGTAVARMAGQSAGLLSRGAGLLENDPQMAALSQGFGSLRDTAFEYADSEDAVTGAPQNRGETVAAVLGSAVPTVASYITAGGMAGRAAAGLPKAATLGGRAATVGAQLLGGAPITAALEADSREGSFAGTLADLTGSSKLDWLSQRPAGRVGVGLAADALGLGVFEGIAHGVSKVRGAFSGAERAAPKSLDDSVDEIFRQHAATTQPAAPAAVEPVAVPSVREAAAAPAAEAIPLRRRAAFAVDQSLEAEHTALQAERRAAEEAAHTDGLTEMANQRAYLKAKPAAEADAGTAFVQFDVNGMKALNDTHGHAVGDDMLRDVAAAVKQAAEEFGVSSRRAFRTGGDEFTILAPADVADKIRARAEELYGVRQHGDLKTSISGGVGGTHAEADAASYAQKEAHKAAQGIPGRDDVNMPALAKRLSEAFGRPVAPDEAMELLLRREGSNAAGEAARGQAAGLGDAARPQELGGEGNLAGRPADSGDLGRGAAPAAEPGPAAGAAPAVAPARARPALHEEARMPSGKRRPLHTVSDDGLILEQGRLMDRHGVQDTSMRLADNGYGDTLKLGSNRQGRAIQRSNDDMRMIREIDVEFRRRGLSSEHVYDRMEELRDLAIERAALQGDYDATKTSFDAERWGRTSPRALSPIVGGGAGAVAGSRVGDTPEERRRNAAVGALAGASLGYLGARLVKGRAAAVNMAGMGDPAVGQVLASVATQPKATVKSAVSDVAAKAYREVVDALYPLRQFGRTMGGSHELSAEVTRASGWQGAGESRIRTQFQPVLKQAKGIEPQVVALATAERALELAKNGMPNKGVDLNAAQRVVASLGAVPEVRKATDALRGYYRSLLDYKLANGVISQEAYDALVQKGEHYIPFVRDFVNEAKSGGEGGSRGLAQFGTGVRKMTDAEAVSLIRNPFEQAVHDTYATERTVSRQRVTNVVADLYDRNPTLAQQFLTEVPMDRAAQDGRIVRITVAGKGRAFEVSSPELYDAWASLAPATQDYAGKILGFFKKGLQTGVTMNPVFAASNAMRDMVHTAAAYPLSVSRIAGGAAIGAATGVATSDDKAKGAITGAAMGAAVGHLGPHAWRTIQALGDIVGHGAGNRAVYEEWLKEGGTGFGYFPRTAQDAKKLVAEMTRKGEFDASKIVNPKSYWDVLHRINSAVEEAPRLARYKHMKGQGASAAEAAAGSRDVSLDFSRMGAGKTVRLAAGSAAFFNPKIQGWDKLFRMFVAERGEDGVLRFGKAQAKAWATAATAITAPSVALWAINSENPEYWNRPLWERNLFWLIPDGEQGFYKVPKPFELGYAFASVPERFLDYLHEKDPGMLKDAIGQMASSSVGEAPIPTALLPLVENAAGPGGFSFFRNQPVVSRDLQQLPTEMQSDDRTSSIARGIGSVAGVSPQKVDNVVQGWTGTLGQGISSAVTNVARRTGLDDRGEPTMPQDRGSFAQRFTARADATPAHVTRFYSMFADAEKVKNGLDRLATNGEGAAIEKYLARRQGDLEAYYRLKPFADAIQSLNGARHSIERDRSTPVADRRRQLLEIREQEATLARQALESQQ